MSDITNRLEIKCPCGRLAIFDNKEGTAEHELPVCREYERMDVLQFIAYVRQSYGLPDPNQPLN